MPRFGPMYQNPITKNPAPRPKSKERASFDSQQQKLSQSVVRR
jgi:hypothetical protein